MERRSLQAEDVGTILTRLVNGWQKRSGQAAGLDTRPVAEPPCPHGCDGSGWTVTPDGRLLQCPCVEDAGRRWRLGRAFRNSGIPERFSGRGLRNLERDRGAGPAIARCEAYRDAWPERRADGEGIALVGPRGVGKTTMAYALSRDVMAAHGAVVLAQRTATLLDSMRDSARDGTAGERVAALAEADLLVLDDLGAHSATDFALERLFVAVDTRYADRKPTAVTCMYDLPRMPSLHEGRARELWSAIVDRLAETCETVVVRGEDRRKPAAAL